MNTYMIVFHTGTSTEIQADFYQADGDEWVFSEGQQEILRVAMAEVASISKFR